MYVEGETLELKREYTDEIKRTIVAFANSKGGELYIGIEDSGEVVGVENADDIIKRISQTILNNMQPDLVMFTSIEAIVLEGKNIVKVTVLEGSDKPYYLKEKGLKPAGVLVRVGSCSVASTESRILQFIKENERTRYVDSISLNQNLTFEKIKSVFQEKGITFSEKQYHMLKIMNLNGFYTNLAHLLSDQCAHTIKVAIFEGKTKSIFKDHKEFAGSLFKQLEEVEAFLNVYNRIHSDFDGLRRIDRPDYPYRGLREVLLNAIIHREYSFSGSILVNLYDDRLEVVSLGGMVAGLTLDAVLSGISQTRNESLANIFYRVEYVEAYGTGIPRLFESYKGVKVQPMIDAKQSCFIVILPNLNYINNEKLTETALEKAPKYSANLLTETEKNILKLFNEKNEITKEDAMRAGGVNLTRIYQILNDMCNKMLIAKIKMGKKSIYVRK